MHLLGTDTLAQLGFLLTERDEGDVRQYDATTGQEPVQVTAALMLIRPAHLPVGHSKLVRVGVDRSERARETGLFKPAGQHLGHRGLTVADAFVGVTPTIVAQRHSGWLKTLANLIVPVSW